TVVSTPSLATAATVSSAIRSASILVDEGLLSPAEMTTRLRRVLSSVLTSLHPREIGLFRGILCPLDRVSGGKVRVGGGVGNVAGAVLRKLLPQHRNHLASEQVELL